MKYTVMGRSQIKLADGSFANVGDEVTEKQLGTKITAYLDNGSIEAKKAAKAAKTASKKKSTKKTAKK